MNRRPARSVIRAEKNTPIAFVILFFCTFPDSLADRFVNMIERVFLTPAEELEEIAILSRERWANEKSECFKLGEDE